MAIWISLKVGLVRRWWYRVGQNVYQVMLVSVNVGLVSIYFVWAYSCEMNMCEFIWSITLNTQKGISEGDG